jgi:hypothetical protein
VSRRFFGRLRTSVRNLPHSSNAPCWSSTTPVAANIKVHYGLQEGKTALEDRLLRVVPTQDNPAATVLVMRPCDMMPWVEANHRVGPHCELLACFPCSSLTCFPLRAF